MKQKKTNKQLLRYQIIKLYILFGFVILLALFTCYSLIMTFTGYERFDEDEYMALYEENVTEAEIESSANEVMFAVPETIESGQQTILSLDNVGYQTWKTRQNGEYYYLPFLSYQPGLYTMVVTPNDDLSLEAVNPFTDDSTFIYGWDESVETTFYNMYLNPTTVLMVSSLEPAPFAIELIPQDEYIKYQNNLNLLGAFPVGTSIEAGNYDFKLSDPDESLVVFNDFFADVYDRGELVSLEPGDVMFVDNYDLSLTKSDKPIPEEESVDDILSLVM